MTRLYCEVSDCDRPVAGNSSTKCEPHLKQWQRSGRTKPITEKLTPEARLIETAVAWLDSDAVDDAQYETRRRAVIQAAKNLAKKDMGVAVREALDAARSRGVRLGRPPKVSIERLRELLKRYGSVAKVAEATGVHRTAIYKRVAKTGIALQPRASGPRAK